MIDGRIYLVIWKNPQNTSWDWYLPGKNGGLDGRIIEVNDFQHAMFDC
jgi:hypothetical protein